MMKLLYIVHLGALGRAGWYSLFHFRGPTSRFARHHSERTGCSRAVVSLDGLISHLKPSRFLTSAKASWHTSWECPQRKSSSWTNWGREVHVGFTEEKGLEQTRIHRNYWPKKRQSAASITHLFQSKWPPENVAVSDGVDILNTRHFLPDF